MQLCEMPLFHGSNGCQWYGTHMITACAHVFYACLWLLGLFANGINKFCSIQHLRQADNPSLAKQLLLVQLPAIPGARRGDKKPTQHNTEFEHFIGESLCKVASVRKCNLAISRQENYDAICHTFIM